MQLIGDGGLTYTDACRCVGISDRPRSTTGNGGAERERPRQYFREFIQELEGAEARFRLVHLGKIRDSALNGSVEKRTVVRRKVMINEAGGDGAGAG